MTLSSHGVLVRPVSREKVSPPSAPLPPLPPPVFEVLCRDSFVVFLDKKAHFSYYFFEAHLFFCVQIALFGFLLFFVLFLLPTFNASHEDRIRFGRNPSKKATTRRAAKKSSAFWRWRWCRRTAGVGGRGGGGKRLTRRASSSTETEHGRTGAT